MEAMEVMEEKKKHLIGALTVCVSSAAVGLFLYYHYGYTVIYSFKIALIWGWLAVIAWIDGTKMVIPNRAVVTGIVAAVFFMLFDILVGGFSPLVVCKDYVMGALFGFGVFALARIVSKHGIGMGDIKLYTALGLLLGWAGVFAVMFFSILCMAVYGIAALLLHKKEKDSQVPMAPFTLLGMLLYILIGI